jgi:hypothetical protein
MIATENIALVIYSGETDDVKSVEIVDIIRREIAQLCKTPSHRGGDRHPFVSIAPVGGAEFLRAHRSALIPKRDA